uniref:AlNc14C39G3338 protein n=1 Tax=Albugo laibachii Nc14 TaxID=890382 RepID=F0W971_9STRA|nr:AlNc14C39G3338 [Albugo laibachii Nc14]|eukprot:CCA17684.1 AlNc14C39G3338 [Albugo laibachii Nc14]
MRSEPCIRVIICSGFIVNGNLLEDVWSGIKGLMKSVLWVDIECENDAFVCPDKSHTYRNVSDHCKFTPCPLISRKNESKAKASEWFMKKEFVVPSVRYEEVYGGRIVAQRLEEMMQWKSGYNVTMDVYTFPSDSRDFASKSDANWSVAVVQTHLTRYLNHNGILNGVWTKENIRYTFDSLDAWKSSKSIRIVSAVRNDDSYRFHSLQKWWESERDARMDIMDAFHALSHRTEATIWITPIDFVFSRILDTLHDPKQWILGHKDMIHRIITPTRVTQTHTKSIESVSVGRYNL